MIDLRFSLVCKDCKHEAEYHLVGRYCCKEGCKCDKFIFWDVEDKEKKDG